MIAARACVASGDAPTSQRFGSKAPISTFATLSPLGLPRGLTAFALLGRISRVRGSVVQKPLNHRTTLVAKSLKRMPNRLRVLELFCGIGGCAAALGERAEIVAAVDINQVALSVYRHNFSHPVQVRAIESLPVQVCRECEADLWWMSPPCQPYTFRGRQLDVHDPRAESLLTVIERIAEIRPRYVALENVPGFCGSSAHQRLRATLDAHGYDVQEQILCPTQLGVPNRRRRFYLVAGRNGSLRELDAGRLACGRG